MKGARASSLTVSDLKKHVGFWLRFVSNHVSHAFARKLQASGVTVAEWVVMREMFDEKEISPGVVAERIGMTRGGVSKLVARGRSFFLSPAFRLEAIALSGYSSG